MTERATVSDKELAHIYLKYIYDYFICGRGYEMVGTTLPW